MSSNRTGPPRRSSVSRSANRSSGDRPDGTTTGLGCSASRHATAASAVNSATAYAVNGSPLSPHCPHSATSPRASGLRSNTVNDDGGTGANPVSNSTDAVVTGRGTPTRIGRPARINAALAGGNTHVRPSASSRRAPAEAQSR